MRHRVVEKAHKRPRGVLLLGVSGSGKSAFCKALGAESGRPTLTLDVGALMGSLVGQTESQTRQALRMADAMAPCILMVDEVEKALGYQWIVTYTRCELPGFFCCGVPGILARLKEAAWRQAPRPSAAISASDTS